MLAIDLLFALALAGLLFFVFGSTIGARGRPEGSGGETAVFFLILFFVIWAGGVWLQPFGPAVYGVFWAPFFVAGLVAVLVLAAGRPSGARHSSRETAGSERALEAEAVTVGWAFWLLLVLLLFALTLRYWG